MPGKPSTLNFQLSTLLLEKLPLLGLAVASCVVTIFAQHEALQSFEQFSLPLRMGNALISYAAYLGQMFWPTGLAVLYPFTAGTLGFQAVVLSLVLLAGISAGVFILRRRRPYFLTGWLWYLIMLVPVIGIVQVGGSGAGGSLHVSAADRVVSVADLGGGGGVRRLALPPRGAGRPGHGHSGGLDVLRARTDFLLAE